MIGSRTSDLAHGICAEDAKRRAFQVRVRHLFAAISSRCLSARPLAPRLSPPVALRRCSKALWLDAASTRSPQFCVTEKI